MSNRKNAAGLVLAFRFAMRELRGGLRGFYIFIACIALGVTAIAGVNSVARAIGDGLAGEGQAILGGDISFSLTQRQASDDELTFIEGTGTITRSANLRAMARRVDGADQTLIELKAVDEAYPLYGRLEIADRIAGVDGIDNNVAWVDQLLLDRLDLGVGDTIVIGEQSFTAAGVITAEPDRVGEGMGFGPKVIVSHAGLKSSGLVQPGSLVQWNYRSRLTDPSPGNLRAVVEQAAAEFPQAGWRVRSRDNAAPALARNIERFSQFLTLVGLSALIVGGVGVANAVRAFVDGKRPVIATLKSVGAPGRMIFQIYLIQILVLAAAGIVIGLVAGAATPWLTRGALAAFVPVSAAAAPVYPGALGLATAYGLLTALVFAIWPLAAARDVPATTLFRASSYSVSGLPRGAYLVALAICVAALIGLAIGLSDNRLIAGIFVSALAFCFVLLRSVAWAIQRLARAAPTVRSTPWRMALGNIHRPGSLTPSVVLSLGLGLALLVTLALIDGNLRRQITDNLPQRSPDFFFVDIQNHERDAFLELLAELEPAGEIATVPMLRGRIVELKGIPASQYKPENGGEWVLRGDRGITYAADVPENSTLAQGEWWPVGYSGPPLISFSAEEAGELGLEVGDTLSVNVLGRNIDATIANLRHVEWESMAINFVMVFSPNTFAGAPHAHLATLTSDGGSSKSDGDILRAISGEFPTITSVRVRDALELVNGLIRQLAGAVRVAASVALLASILVLAGALAAGNAARVHDSVILKTLGATRGTLIRTFVCEYFLLGLATAVFAIVAGGLASWFVIAQVMEFPARFMPSVAVLTVAAALVATVGFGLAGTWRVLGHKAAPVLREL